MQLDLKRSTRVLAVFIGTSVINSIANAQTTDFVDVSLAAQHDDNISRAFLSSDRHSDASALASLSAGRLLQLPNLDTLTFFAELSSAHFQTLKGLNSNTVTLGTRYQRKFGLGAFAPILSSTFHWSLEESRTKVRSRHLQTLDINFQKRLSNAWEFSAGLSLEQSEGKYDGVNYASSYNPNNDILDFTQASAFAGFDYTFANYSTLSASYSYIDGNTLSSALAPNPALLAIAQALTIDAAIPAPTGRNIVAYTLETKAHIWSVDWSYPIGRDTSVTATYSWQDIAARAGIDYSNNRISLTLMHILK